MFNYRDDKSKPDSNESVLNYLVDDEGIAFDVAINKLDAAVRQWLNESSISFKSHLSFAGVSLIGAFCGAGVWTAPAFLSVLANGGMAFASKEEVDARQREKDLLKQSPEIKETLRYLHSQGVPPKYLVLAYDRVVGSFNGDTCHGYDPIEALKLSLQATIEASKTSQETATIAFSLLDGIDNKAKALYGSSPDSAQRTFDGVGVQNKNVLPAASDNSKAFISLGSSFLKEEEPVMSEAPIGKNTQLREIEVKSKDQTVREFVDSTPPPRNVEAATNGDEEDAWDTSPIPDYAPFAGKPKKTALDTLLQAPYISRALFGAQRTGKSFLASVASLKLSEAGTNIYHLNLASFGDEDGKYWKHAKRTIQNDLSGMDGDEAATVIQDAIDLVNEFFADPNGSILIVDEIAYLGATSNAHARLLDPLLTIIADKITTLSSSGMKRRKAIWTIAPEFVAGALTQQAKAVKKLKLCYVTISPGRFIDWQGSKITFNAELFEQVKNNYPIQYPDFAKLPNSDRICFVDDRWLEVGELAVV